METMPTKEAEEALIQHMMRAVEGGGHEIWRAPRKQEDGTYEPRLKELDLQKDGEWMAANEALVLHRNTKPEVDIANLSFEQLPPSRQEDTRESFHYAFEAVLRAAHNGTPHDEAFIDATADTIHERWVMRNEKSAEPEQLLPYAQLSEEEREKDRKYVRLALEQYEEYRKRQEP